MFSEALRVMDHKHGSIYGGTTSKEASRIGNKNEKLKQEMKELNAKKY